MTKIVTITLSEASWIEGGGSLSFLTPKTLFIFLFFFLFLHRRKNGAIRRRLTSRDEKRRRNVEEKPSKKRIWFQWEDRDENLSLFAIAFSWIVQRRKEKTNGKIFPCSRSYANKKPTPMQLGRLFICNYKTIFIWRAIIYIYFSVLKSEFTILPWLIRIMGLNDSSLTSSPR